jgi:two-component system, LytTR family, response regulator
LQVRTLIIEDEPLARKTLHDFSAEFTWLKVVGEAADGATAIKLIDKLHPQLIFLDVQMPEISGLEVLRRAKHRPAVVFTTALGNYAVTAFEFEAIDFLLKPFGRERFQQTMQRVEKHFKTSEIGEHIDFLTRLFVRDKQRIVPLQVEEIIWLEANDDYTFIHTKDKNYLVGLTLKEFSQRLDPTKFFRIHRSAIINIDQINEIEEFDRRLLFYMKDGKEVQASRQGSQLIKKFIA